MLLPMGLAALTAGMQGFQRGTELGQPACLGQVAIGDVTAAKIPRRRIAGFADGFSHAVFAQDHQTRSMMVAAPMPDAMHSVARPTVLSWRSSSSSRVPMMIAPVAPSGWPSAMAPPLTFTLSGLT